MTVTPDSSGTLSVGSRSTERPADAGYTLVAGLEGIAPASVDGGGLVTPFGANWTLDWWVGADDRWHLPAREPAVRQRRIGHGPIVETSLRVSSGDVLHTVYPVVVPGGMATVIEIANESPVPVALAMAIRPFPVDPAATSTASSTGSSTGRSTGPSARPGMGIEFAAEDLVTVDGHPALQLPRRPNEVGGSATADLLDTLAAGETVEWPGSVDGPNANAVLLYPLPHRTSLRFAVPGPGVSTVALDGLADAASSARGWTVVVDRASSYQFPDSGVTDLVGAARARLLLAAPTLADAVVDGLTGAGEVLAGLAMGGHRLECRQVLDAVSGNFPTAVPSAAEGAALVDAIGLAAEMLGEVELAEQLLAPASQLTHLVERAVKKQRRDPLPAAAASRARVGLARLAALVGQVDAVADLTAADGPGGTGAPDAGEPDLIAVTTMAEAAAPARRFPGPIGPEASDEPDDAAVPDSSVGAARLFAAARMLMLRPGSSVGVEPAVVELLPDFPSAWRGGTVELHKAPMFGAQISFAIRWHGYRPALLWEVDGDRVIELRCPGLDPDWRTTESKGEALLTGLAEELPDAPMPGDSFS